MRPTETREINETRDRATAPGPHTFTPALPPPIRAPPLVPVGISRCLSLPGSPLLLDPIHPWGTAQIFAHAGICPLSIPWPFPPLSRALSAGLSTGCSGGRDAPASAAFRVHTTSTCRPLGVQTALGMFQPAHARSSVCRTLLAMISRLSLGWISCSQLRPSFYIGSVWSTCRTPTSSSPAVPPSVIRLAPFAAEVFINSCTV